MEYIERTVSYLTKNIRGHDSKLITKSPVFASHPNPTIAITSPTCGPSGSTLTKDYTQDGADLFPSLTWTLPSSIPPETVKEYLLLVEDADGPLGFPILHGGYYSIPAFKTSVKHEDFEVVKGNELRGGFRYAKNLRGTVYSGPKPLRGHGLHRYFFEVVALSESLGEMSSPARKEEILRGVEGRVLGWGEWVGVAERK